ncbi:MAG: cytochrome c3 family protein, partial [Planctomycetota bacterium]
SCHGRVDRMEEVIQRETLSMGWCLDCHRNPDPHLRSEDKITDMDWHLVRSDDPAASGKRIREMSNINPSTDCSTCHR